MCAQLHSVLAWSRLVDRQACRKAAYLWAAERIVRTPLRAWRGWAAEKSAREVMRRRAVRHRSGSLPSPPPPPSHPTPLSTTTHTRTHTAGG